MWLKTSSPSAIRVGRWLKRNSESTETIKIIFRENDNEIRQENCKFDSYIIQQHIQLKKFRNMYICYHQTPYTAQNFITDTSHSSFNNRSYKNQQTVITYISPLFTDTPQIFRDVVVEIARVEGGATSTRGQR